MTSRLKYIATMAMFQRKLVVAQIGIIGFLRNAISGATENDIWMDVIPASRAIGKSKGTPALFTQVESWRSLIVLIHRVFWGV